MKKLFPLLLIVCCISCSDKQQIHIKLLNGLTTESRIYRNDSEVGNIEDIRLLEKYILVSAKIDREIKISKNAKFILTDVGLVTSGISVEKNPDKNYLKSGDTILGIMDTSGTFLIEIQKNVLEMKQS